MLFKVLEMELKTHTQVNLKFIFEKIKFKVLRYIQYDFNAQGSVSIRLAYSKALLLTISSSYIRVSVFLGPLALTPRPSDRKTRIFKKYPYNIFKVIMSS